MNTAFRCRRIKSNPAYVHPGDVNRMFENLVANFTKYKPVVMSRDRGWWCLTSFLTDEEVEGVMEHGAKNLKRSVDAGEMQADGKFKEIISTARTSENSWCVRGCWKRTL
eukprot:TRINITY_DN3075_c0_g1_i1.p1 TRINITY_DN3075_c0_g1~~TRINITY_DN3075_c0_g1_i1.p1  ORF type:complete len:110 (-),score=14.06 TRINITY_DN3075_c0_g1_i1:374-703(-)